MTALDGSVGEGGGQVLRVAAALAALSSTAVTINNIRANRSGSTGLKQQHLAALEFLAEHTGATVEGLQVGSKTVRFTPKLPPTIISNRHLEITPGSAAASAMLILQALLPFLLFASDAGSKPIHLKIHSGTHTSGSPSFDYIDQVLLPILEQRWGIHVERSLSERGWSIGPATRGLVSFTIHTVMLGKALCLQEPVDRFLETKDYVLSRIDATIIVPEVMFNEFEQTLRMDISILFPGVEMHTKVLEDSGTDRRVYVLLVAISNSGLRWGNDLLYAIPKKAKGGKQKNKNAPWEDISRKVTKGLHHEVSNLSQCDSHAQDQLVVFQAIASGLSSIPRREHPVQELKDLFQGLDFEQAGKMRKERTTEPFGDGTPHASTARYIAAQLLPSTSWYYKGNAVHGAGIKFSQGSTD